MATERDDLARILERVRQGDEAASRSLIERLYPTVIRVVRAHLPRRQDEEDLAQEVFLRLFARLDRYTSRPGVPFAHWVSRLALRTCLDALRAERRRPELRWADLTPEQAAWVRFLSEDEAAAPAGSAREAREVVERLLGQLGVDDRLVLHLLDLQEKSVREVSRLTGWSVAAVKVRAFRARRRLRKLVETHRREQGYEYI